MLSLKYIFIKYNIIMSNILFYSDKCEFSIKFIQKIKDKNMLNSFKMINILKIKDIPSNITTIPTIIVPNINIPLSGDAAFNWVDNYNYFYQPTNNINIVQKINIINPNIQNSHHDLLNEVTTKYKKNKSDDYANLKDEDDEKITKTKFNPINQNINITNLNNIKDKINDIKTDSIIQTKKMDDLMVQRKIQMMQFINGKKKN